MKPAKPPLHIRTMVINIQDQMRDVAPKQKALPYFNIDTLTTDQALETIVTGIYWGVQPLRWGAQPFPNHMLHLLRQRRILARHLLEKNQTIAEDVRNIDIVLRRFFDLQAELDATNARANEVHDRLAATSEKLGDALTEKLAAEARADRMEQMFGSLQIDFNRACCDRTNAIARAIAAEERAAQADRILSQILSELHAPRTLRRTGTWLDRVIGFLFRLSPKEAHA